MKKIFCAFGLLAGVLEAATAAPNNDNPFNSNAVLQSVVVYRSGAALTHAANASLPAGNVELAIDRLSTDMDLNSVEIHVPAAVTLLGFSYVSDFLAVQPLTPQQQHLQDSLDRLQENQDKIKLDMANNDALLDVLKTNRELKGTQTGMNVGELEKLMDYYKAKSGELTSLQSQLVRRYARIGDQIEKVKAQLNEEETKNTKESGRLVLRLLVAEAGNYDFSLSYITGNAGWSPAYEVQVKDTHGPVKVVYKANISQTTGLDWKQVKMALSTSVPGSWSQAPELNPWFVSFQQKPKDLPSYGLEGKVAGVQVQSSRLDEVVVIGYGGTKKKQLLRKNDLSDYTNIDEQQLNTVYTIDLPYDLLSNGKEQTASLKTIDVPALFKYFAVPKMTEDVFLLADIPDWGKLNLLPGNANILMEGTFVGQTRIDPSSTQDTLHLTLGRDKRVTIQRRKVSDVSAEKFLNSNQSHKYAYEITVRNNKKDEITLSLLDQIPLSTNKDIEVNLLDADNAAVDTDKGELKWQVPLKSGESQKVHFTYTVKYPKVEQLTIR